MAIKKAWTSYRTVIGAVVSFVVLGWMVHRGQLTASRAVVPAIFAVMLALHASDYRHTAEEHARTVLAGTEHEG